MAFEIDENVLRFLNGHLGNNDEDAYKRCSDFAYRDMCRTITFASDYKESKEKGSKVNNEIAQNKRDKRDKITEVIKKQIEQWIKNTPSEEDFNSQHTALCSTIIDEYKGTTDQGDPKNSLYFGQAQKWVNMTLKNLYVYSESNRTQLSLKSLLPYMHIPIDSIIMDIAAGSKKCYVDNNTITYGIKKPKNGNNKEICWSKFDETTYKEYQKALTDKIKETHPSIDPIIWELTHWSTVTSEKEK